MSIKSTFENHIFKLQDKICQELENIDAKAKFKEDKWEREEGGGGKTRIIRNGNLIEKGGVNTSVVYGELPDLFKKKFKTEEATFYACGISLVIHPFSPKIPTVHANWRYFEMYDKNNKLQSSWFGGGSDLTPYYLDDDDARHFHQTNKDACDLHHQEYYPTFKKACDEYFYNSHRQESRGIGGIFFDYLKEDKQFSMNDRLNFAISSSNSFLDAYLPIVKKHEKENYSEEQKVWQEIRRGRYVEFNLLHDRGTHFGIKTNGRTESILMSLPSTVRWEYNHHPEAGSEEEKLIKVLKHPKDWV
jgi:coproporphyrinogen III oxidase|tara:strand:+ start:1593 stop:2501 length:909 start_codon:yes stop_codon:yes gene_type:complete